MLRSAYKDSYMRTLSRMECFPRRDVQLAKALTAHEISSLYGGMEGVGLLALIVLNTRVGPSREYLEDLRVIAHNFVDIGAGTLLLAENVGRVRPIGSADS